MALNESMATLKRELTKRYTWKTRLDLELALVTYIGWYNARRRHLSLKTTGTGGSGDKRLCRSSRATLSKSPGKPRRPRNRADVEPGAFQLPR